MNNKEKCSREEFNFFCDKIFDIVDDYKEEKSITGGREITKDDFDEIWKRVESFYDYNIKRDG